MFYLALYLLLLPPCFFLAYCEGVESRYRIENPNLDGPFGQYLKTLYREGFKLLIYDHFKLHNPWSWEISKKYRVAWVRETINRSGTDHVLHNVLGKLTLERCDDPTQHEKIAYECFVSRTRFWLEAFVGLLISPIPGLWIAAWIPVEGVMSLLDQRQKKQA